MVRMLQSITHDPCRRAGFGYLLCLALSVPETVCGIETLSHTAAHSPYIHLPTQPADPMALQSHGYTESFIRAAVNHDREEYPSNYRWKAPPAGNPDWRGVRRDTWYFIGYQFAAVGILYVAPESISGWSDEDKEDNSFTKWKDNVGNPRWDDDRWWINYVLHPYWGGAYYIRAQERGLDRGQSFLYSALLSTLFEFGAEAMFEAPSYQDLVVTPVVGYMVGHYLFTPLRKSIRARQGEPGWADKTVLFLTDPLGVVNMQMDRVFGVNADISLQLGPMVSDDRRVDSGQARLRQPGDPSKPETYEGWGLHLRIVW